MALQGTLDTFALPDVLRLLGSTAKTGRLRVTGDRGSGSVWVVDGQVVATENVSGGSDNDGSVAVVFSMLRYEVGSFTFENDATTSAASSPESIDSVLGQAELQLAEWQTIAEVVPSLESWATLRQELEGRDVVIDSARWRVIVTIGSGATVGTVGEALGLGELPSCRAVKELVDLQLVEVGEAPEQHLAASTVVTSAELAPEPAPVEEPDTEADTAHDWSMESFEASAAEETWTPEATLEPTPEPEPEFAPEPVSWAADPLPDDRGPVGFDSLAIDDELTEPEPVMAAVAPSDDLDPAEMARQLANLSPKAAKAVAAAAKASTSAEREAALAAVEAEDSSVDRGLLMKFLGTVDG